MNKQIDYKSQSLDGAVLEVWERLFDRIAQADSLVDRAVWLIDASSGYILARYGGPEDDPMDADWEPPDPAVLSICGLDMAFADLDDDWDALSKDLCLWVEPSIVKIWKSNKIQNLQRQTERVSAKFGVYSSTLFDAVRVDQMKWLAGDKLSLIKPKVKKKYRTAKKIRGKGTA